MGGSITILDKFLPKNRKISFIRKVINPLANLFFTDINRKFESIVNATSLKVVSDIDAHFKGKFRIIKLVKQTG
jgi:phosphatidylethanolamine/phosphatidyl-N-methylethanolamine N-methyltransferase